MGLICGAFMTLKVLRSKQHSADDGNVMLQYWCVRTLRRHVTPRLLVALPGRSVLTPLCAARAAVAVAVCFDRTVLSFFYMFEQTAEFFLDW